MLRVAASHLPQHAARPEQGRHRIHLPVIAARYRFHHTYMHLLVVENETALLSHFCARASYHRIHRYTRRDKSHL